MKTRSMVLDIKKRQQYLDNESPLCKEILISKPQLASEYSGQTYSDLDTPTPTLSHADTETSKTHHKIELTCNSEELRKNFYEFQKSVSDLEPYTSAFLKGLKKHLQFKLKECCSPQELLDYFEPILFKLAKNPKQVRKNWSENETLLLINVVIYYCLLKGEEAHSLSDEAYRYLASVYPGKKEEQIKLRWQSLLKVTLSKAPWTREEDEFLTAIVQERGPHRWKNVALELARRSGSAFLRQGKQCRERWINHLDPSLRKEGWDDQEDLKLLNLLIDLGKKWAEIAKKLGGRTENNVKNRWISLLRRYRSHLESNPPSLELDDKSDCIEKDFAQAILNAKTLEDANPTSKKLKITEPQSARLPKAEEDLMSFGEGSGETSSASDVSSQIHSNAKSVTSSPVKQKKVSRTSKKIVENLAKNLEKKELTKATSKRARAKQTNPDLPILSSSLTKVEWDLEALEPLKNSLLVPPLVFTQAEPKSQIEENKSFELLTKQFKLLPSMLDSLKHSGPSYEFENDFIKYPHCDEDHVLKIPILSRRSSVQMFSDPSPQNNSMSMISRGLANSELFSMKEETDFIHSIDSKAKENSDGCVKSPNELDFFCPSITTDMPHSLESLDNHNSKLYSKPSIIRRRLSIEQYLSPQQHQDHHHHQPHYTQPSHENLNAKPSDSLHHGQYYFQPLNTKKDSLFMIDEPIEEQYEDPNFNGENLPIYHPKYNDFPLNWGFKANEASNQFSQYNLNFTKNTSSEYSQSFDRKF